MGHVVLEVILGRPSRDIQVADGCMKRELKLDGVRLGWER